MKNPETYDEWRAFLGLPDVPEQVKIRARFRRLTGQITSRILPMWEHLTASLGPALEQFTIAAGRWALDPELPAAPDTRTPQQRALPRPSTSPPMWAIDHRRKGKAGRHGL